MGNGKRVLLLGVYGMEVVECGGALAKNVENGGESFASIMLSRENSRPQIIQAANVLGVKMNFTEFASGHVDLSVESKKKLVRVIREVKPDIIITQDPEHSYNDLDPDRRPAMLLILESIALAARDFALDEMPDLEPHPIATIYYMTPHHPNTVIDVSTVWEKKDKAMDVLESQMEFSGRYFDRAVDKKALEVLAPGFQDLKTYYEKGRAIHRALDKAVHAANGIASHNHFALAEAFRRDGCYHLQELMV